MTDYTARNVLLKDSNGNYLIPYTEKADLSLGNLNSAGKAYVAIKGYDSTAAYSLNEVVMTVVSGSVKFYRSLADNNTASLSDTTKWDEVRFGSGANVDLSNLSATGQAKFDAKANVSLNNLDATGQAKFDAKANVSLNNLDATGKAKFDAKANVSLNNLDATGEAHFANPSLSNLTATGNALVFKPGMMIPWGGTSSNKPDGWLVCDGSAISRTTYSALFAIIGTAYGAGDGSTTFNLPNASNLYLMKTNTTPSVGVKGTGKSLGLRTTSNAYGLCQGGSGGIAYTNAYNVNAGTSVTIYNLIPSSTAIGVSTDSRTSGLNTDTGSMSAITSRLIIKY